MTGPDRQLWLKSPGRLLEHLGITEPQDIELESIAQACGATIVYQPLEGCEARLVGAGRRAIITVNSQTSRARQRFSAAHELGHWMHDRGRVAFACAEGQLLREWGEANVERRANRFAADLLLPRNMFKRHVRTKFINFGLVRQLAEQFTTSLTATAIRLVEYGSFPAMLACYYGGVRRWSVRSHSVPETLQLKLDMPPWTAAARHQDGTASPAFAAARAFPAELWIDHPDAAFYTVYAETCQTGGDTVLALLTWRDEGQLIDAAVTQH